MEAARGRVWALLHPRRQRRGSKKRTALALEMGPPLAQEGPGPQAHSAVAHGVRTLELTRGIERVGQPWGSEVEGSRPSQWQGPERRVAAGAAAWRREPPDSFRPGRVRGRQGALQQRWAVTKVGRLKRYGRKRFGRVHAHADLSEAPRFLRTDALHGESGGVLETWSSRWALEIFHAFAQQVTGLEAAQGRQEEAVQRHCRLRGVAQSLVQQAPASGATAERLACAKGESTYGQRGHTIVRAAWAGLLRWVASLLARGRTCEDILALLLPA